MSLRLNLRDLSATEAALHTVMMAFNLMSLFKQALLKQTIRKDGTDKPIRHTLSTLRHQLFAQPGFITHEGRRPLLKLATAMQKREWISGPCGINPNSLIYPCRSPHNLRLVILPNGKSGLNRPTPHQWSLPALRLWQLKQMDPDGPRA